MKNVSKIISFGSIFLILISVAIFLYIYTKQSPPPVQSNTQESRVKAFQSAEEMREYLQENSEGTSASGFGGSLRNFAPSAQVTDLKLEEDSAITRFSETNTVERGIDEADIVKTDGQNIYVSEEGYRIYPLLEKRVVQDSFISPDMPINPTSGQTTILKAFPPAEISKLSQISNGGELYYINNNLIVINNEQIKGYDVTDKSNPKEVWVNNLDNSRVLSSRMTNGLIYLITQSGVNINNPCPMPLFTVGEQSITVPCGRIYYPNTNFEVNSTFTASLINPLTGTVDKTVSFVGSEGTSVVSLSGDSLYITYSYPGDYLTFYSDFIKDKASDLIGQDVQDRINHIKDLDISSQSKLTELNLALQKFYGSKSSEERLRIESEVNNRLTQYATEKRRELEKTGITKINLSSMEIVATTSIPGTPLNSFSLNEYKGNLRIATTVGNNWMFRTETVNDVYVLDSNLGLMGKIEDLGIGERIYSARFIEDRGYLVTFKQIDPFFILDLTDPKNPQKTGELKIPGYSSYLHPLKNNLILGVGNENGGVKLTLFDVSNSANPIELNTYRMDEFWTEVSNNHHAFLQDSKHNVFFIPGGKGGYVFSYLNNTLSLKKTIPNTTVLRALYLNDYLYTVGRNSINVVDENNWQTLREIAY